MNCKDFNTNIANQCPADGGNAVYKARTLLEIATDEDLYFVNEELCSPQLLIGGNPGTINHEAASTSVQLFPNPGKDVLTLKWQDLTGTEGLASLKDLTGRTVMVQALDLVAGTLTMDLNGLQPGMYFCEIRVDDKPVFSEKYVLIK